MWLTQTSIKRPFFILMVILFLVLVGSVAYTSLGAEYYPKVDIPVVVVVVPYPGAGPQEVENRVTKVVEDAVAGSNGLKYLTSISQDGMALVQLEFNLGVDTSTATTDIERKVSAVRSQFPDEAKAPSVIKAEFDALPIMAVSLSGNAAEGELNRLAQDKIKPRLEAVSGVASVRVVGGLEREIIVKVDQSSLQSRGLSIQQVYGALAQGNVSMPSGTVDQKGMQYNIRLNGLLKRPEDLRDIVVYSSPSGTVFLRDVAEVVDGFKTQKILYRTDSVDAVGLLITKASNSNTMEVAAGLRKTMAEVQKTLPAGTKMTLASDGSIFVKQSLDDVQINLFQAVILTAVVLLLFLHSFRSTLIVLFAIPTSLISTFMMMWIMGFTLNLMSMMALALCVGILVDDSIVVLENIFRHLKLGETPWTAALKGRSEIGLAAIAITLVDVVVYVPIAFTSGMTGQFFRQFGLVVAVATLFSLFVSFTLTPMLASRWLKPDSEEDRRSIMGRFGRKWEDGYESLARAYHRVLVWALGHRKTVVAVALTLFLSAVALIPLNLIGMEFLPVEDQSELNLIVEMPPGTALGVTQEVVKQLESRIARVPEVTNYFSTLGQSNSSGLVNDDPRYALITVKLVPKERRTKSSQQMARELQKLGAGVPGLTLRAQMPSNFGNGSQPFLAVIKGDDPVLLMKVAADITERVKRIPGTTDVTNSSAAGSPEAQFQVDHQRLADLGLNAMTLATTLRTNVEGDVVTQLRPEGQDRVDIRVVGSDADKSVVEGLGALPVASPKGQITRLDQAATLEFVESPTQIWRMNREYAATIGANLDGRPLGDVVADFRKEMDNTTLPPGFSYEMFGDSQAMDESFTSLATALGMSILFMYMLMVALYESPIYPLVIMFSLPVSFVGAFGALAITGRTLNIASMIGLIMLMGLVGKNAILLVDYTNTLRARGRSRFDALVEAGPTRLRPILMTTAAMVMAMLPAALSIGDGAELRSGMATVVIGGLLSSTLLTLLLVPVMYTLLDDLQNWLGRKILRRSPGAAKVEILAQADVAREETPKALSSPKNGACHEYECTK